MKLKVIVSYAFSKAVEVQNLEIVGAYQKMGGEDKNKIIILVNTWTYATISGRLEYLSTVAMELASVTENGGVLYSSGCPSELFTNNLKKATSGSVFRWKNRKYTKLSSVDATQLFNLPYVLLDGFGTTSGTGMYGGLEHNRFESTKLLDIIEHSEKEMKKIRKKQEEKKNILNKKVGDLTLGELSDILREKEEDDFWN